MPLPSRWTMQLDFNSRPRGRAVLAELADYYCATYISILALAGGRSAKMDAMRVAFFHICHKV